MVARKIARGKVRSRDRIRSSRVNGGTPRHEGERETAGISLPRAYTGCINSFCGVARWLQMLRGFFLSRSTHKCAPFLARCATHSLAARLVALALSPTGRSYTYGHPCGVSVTRPWGPWDVPSFWERKTWHEISLKRLASGVLERVHHIRGRSRWTTFCFFLFIYWCNSRVGKKRMSLLLDL